MNRLFKALLVTLFLVVIFIPATGWLAGWNFNAGIEEKRTPTPWPTLADLKKDAAGAAKQFENAFSDRFAFRNALIKTDAWLNWKVFGISTTDSVLVGHDGWLFFTGDRSVPLFQGIDRFTDADSAFVTDALEMRHHWLRDQGIASAHVIAPAKESVYPEFMPPGVPRVKQPSSMEAFFASGGEPQREGQPIDLLTAFAPAKRDGRLLYLRGDSHWNDAGALIAYREIMKRLGLEQSGLSDNKLQSHVDPTTHPYHDLATMLGITDTYWRDWPNDSPVITPTGGWTFETQTDAAQRRRITTNKSALIDKSVLMFGDSFSEALLPFLAQTFSSVTLYQGRFFSPAKVGEHKPQVVVCEGAERLFFHNRPTAAEEARVIANPVWQKRISEVGAKATLVFDSVTTGWRDAAAKPKQPMPTSGALNLRLHDKRVSLSVPLDLSKVNRHDTMSVQLSLATPHGGLLKWQFEHSKTDDAAPSWPIHVELLRGTNDIAFGLPAKGSTAISRLVLSLQTDADENVGVSNLRVVAIPSAP